MGLVFSISNFFTNKTSLGRFTLHTQKLIRESGPVEVGGTFPYNCRSQWKQNFLFLLAHQLFDWQKEHLYFGKMAVFSADLQGTETLILHLFCPWKISKVGNLANWHLCFDIILWPSRNLSTLINESWRPKIWNFFEITRTIYSNSEWSEQCLVTECFFNLFLEVFQI